MTTEPPPPEWVAGARKVGATERIGRRVGLVGALLAGALALILAIVAVVEVIGPDDTIAFDEVRIDLAKELPALRDWVQRERGLRFTEAVEVDEVPDPQFLVELRRNEATAASGVVEEVETLHRALGWLAPEAEIPDTLHELQEVAVAGFYDVEQGRIALRGLATVRVLPIVVHELVHALQDQHFGLEGPASGPGETDRRLAWASVVEGDATRLAEKYLGTLDEDRRELIRRDDDRVRSEAAAARYAAIPEVIREQVHFLYESGEAYVTFVANAEGPEAVDALFGMPPASTAQVIRRLPSTTAPPPAIEAPAADGGEAVGVGVLGELGLRSMLAGRRFAATAGSQWGGDRYTTSIVGGRPCFDGRFVATTDGPRTLAGELADWAEERGGTFRREDADHVVVHVCGGGS